MFGHHKHKHEFTMEEQASKLAEMRGLLTSEVNELVSDDDCRRFLVARKYDIDKSVDMLNKWAKWYFTPFSHHDIENKTLRPVDLLHVAADNKEQITSDICLWSNSGEDKEGRPIYWEKPGILAAHYDKIKKVLTPDEMLLRHIRTQEILVDRLKKASLKHNKTLTKSTVVFDLNHLPMAPDRAAFTFVQRCANIDEAFYPERLEKVFIINAPFYLPPIWSMVKGWLDPVTAKKIEIYGSNYHDILKEYIADDQIPVEFGGTKEDFSWSAPGNNIGYNIVDVSKNSSNSENNQLPVDSDVSRNVEVTH